MEIFPGRLAGVRPAPSLIAGIAGMLWLCVVTPDVAAEPLTKVGFPALPGGRPCQSVMVPFADPPIHVTVVPRGANPQQPSSTGDGVSSVRVIGHDPVSRLGFLENRGSRSEHPGYTWLDSADACVGISLKAIAAEGPVPCRITGWEKQVGGKILPLGLLKVEFQNEVPAPGTPLLDDRNRIAGLVFQAAAGGRTGYAIPAEAVHRVCRDIRNGGVLVRPRLGLTLNAQNPSARIVRVLPGSPAADAGIRPDDVLLQVGGHSIRAYADVPDAFFYLVPGKPAHILVQRGTQRIAATVTPERTN